MTRRSCCLLLICWTLGAGAPAAAAGGVRLALGGDAMLARGVGNAIRTHGPAYPWGDVLPLLRRADLTLINLECVIARAGNEFMPRRAYYFRAPVEAGQALVKAGIDVVSLANNHVLDFRAGGLTAMLGHLDRLGIAHAGAGADLAHARRPAMVDKGGLRIAVIGLANHYHEYAATADRAGINYTRVATDPRTLAPLRQSIAAARRAGADLVIVSMHWGPNLNPAPLPGFPAFARAVIDSGADIFHGHSAHLFQGIEFYHGGLILYDTGDLLDDYRVYPRWHNDRQLLFLIDADKGGVRTVHLVPLQISDDQVNRARGAAFKAIEKMIRAASAPFGTGITRDRRMLRAFALPPVSASERLQ